MRSFGCWLLQRNWSGQQLEPLHLALLPVANHSGAIGSYIWDGARVRCRRSTLEIARPISPISRAAHRTSVRFALSGTSICIAERAAGICMSLCMRMVGSAANGGAADRVCVHRDRKRGLIRMNACTKVRSVSPVRTPISPFVCTGCGGCPMGPSWSEWLV